MSILSFPTRPSARHPVRTHLTSVSTLWTDAVLAWRTRRATHAMQSLSDELLHDIGVDRGEIEQMARYGRPDRT